MKNQQANIIKIMSFSLILLFFGLISASVTHAENYTFATKWNGNSYGQFNSPKAAAVDSLGNIYVVDTGNNRIQKFSSSGIFLANFGSSGSGNGQFNNPLGIALDSSGNVYVADAGNDRIQKFDRDGVYLIQWGSSGSGDGQLNSPQGIAVETSGNIYIADTGNHRIQKFDSSGGYLTEWGYYGNGDGQFNYPYGITVDSSGDVYVSDAYNHRIQKFDNSGTFLAKFGSWGSEDGQLWNPTDVAIDSSGNIYVDDMYNNRIQKFSINGTFLNKWGTGGSGDGQFNYPYGIAVDSSGNVYVADTSNHRIQKFDNSGIFLTKSGTYGGGDGQFNYPCGIAKDSSGNICVADWGSNRIQKFDSFGNPITQWGFGGNDVGQFNSPYGIAFDSSGNVYVSDYNNNRIQKFNSSGTFLIQWGSYGSGDGQLYHPTGVDVDSSGNVYVAEEGNNRIQKFSSSGELIDKWGTLGSSDGQFSRPSGVAVDYSGNVYVADISNSRIQKFSSNGTFLTKWGDGGNGDGQFNDLRGVAVDSSDNVYVADRGNHRIQKFDSSGIFLTRWGSYGSGEGQFNSPEGITVDSSGNVYVSDSGNNRIQMFSELTFANFSTNITQGYAPLSVQFTDLSENATQWNWDFGDGATSINRNPAHTYSVAGRYIVNLTVSNANDDTSSKLTTISLLTTNPVYYSGNGHYYALISTSPVGITWESAKNAAQSSSYSDMTGYLATITSQDENDFIVSLGGHDYWLGGIQPSGSTEPDGGWQWVTDEPWSYTNWDPGQPDNGGGVEDVLHFHGNSKWNDLSHNTQLGGYIVEYEGNHSTSVPPVANFSTNVTSGYAPLSVQFTDLSENAAQWNWDFGDGANSTLKSPKHTYPAAGNYIVNLTVRNTNGTNSTLSTITVSPTHTENYTFATKWNGNSYGQFNSPKAAVVDSSGDIYVVDTGNNRIQKFSSSGTFLFSFGFSGSGNGQFNNPLGVALDSSGNVYVTDAGNDRIQKFDSNGEYLTQWGSSGSGDGQLNSPQGIVIDSSGNVYVADTNNHRIQKFDSSGGYLTEWGYYGSGDGQFSYPYGVAVDSSSNIYVADSGNHRIQKFDSSGAFLAKLGSWGSEDGQFWNPYGVAVDSSGNIYVADEYNQRIQKFDSSNGFLTKWGSYGSVDGQFINPYSVAVDSSGNIYVVDTSNHRIQKFSGDGTFLIKLGTGGGGSGQLNHPIGIAKDSFGNVYVSDTENSRILKYSSSGYPIAQWNYQGSGDGQFYRPFGVAVDSSDNVYVADYGNHRIQKFSGNGTFLTKWGSYGNANGQFINPCGIAVDSSGNVYVADTSNHRIQKFSSSGGFIKKWGSYGSSNGLFIYPTGIAVDSSGNVYAADNNNHRIQKFSSNGSFLTKWGSYGSGDGQFINPYGVAVDTSGNVYIADYGNHRIQKFSGSGIFLNQWGSYGSGEGQFDRPHGVAVDSSGNVYVADTFNNRIQMFSGLTFANFRTNVIQGYAPLSVQYTDLSKDATEWHWDFGDGTTSTDSNSTHIYSTAGKYVVNLTVSKANGDKSSKLATISVLKTTPVYYSGNSHYYDSISVAPGGITWEEANLLAQALSYSGMTGHLATFSSQDENDFIVSLGGYDYWLGGIQQSNSTEPDGGWQWVTGESWSYSNWDSGQPSNSYGWGYPINLPWGYAEDALQFQGNSKWNDIPRECPITGFIVEFEVNQSTSELPVVNFSTNVTSGYAPLSVQFTDLSENATGWNWDFGDGINSTLKSLIHTYPIAGTYKVNLTVSNAKGTNSKLSTINVSIDPKNYTFATKWNGNSYGQFNSPKAAAVDSSGDIYVVDTGNNRIQKFSSTGAFLLSFGSSGSGNGQFNNPLGIALDSTSNVYVADAGNNRIQKFDSNGVYLAQWGSSGSGDGQINSPQGIVIDSSGNVYVADTNNHRIQKFDRSGGFLSEWGYYGSGDGQLSYPYDIALDSMGNIYVADSGNHRIQKFDSSGTFLTKFGSWGSEDGQFWNPYGVAVDSSGNVYVADEYNQRIQKFSNDGTFLTKWGSGGSGDNQFWNPYDVSLDSSGNVYVADTSNHRIQKFTSDGTFLSKLGTGGGGSGLLNNPIGIAKDSSGNVYVADTENSRIMKYTSNGYPIIQWNNPGSGDGQFYRPHGIALDSSGNVYVADLGNSRIQKISSNGTFLTKWGSYGNGNGQFINPTDIALDSSGNVHVADFGNNRIQKFSSSGEFIKKWGSPGSSNGLFSGPAGVAVDSSGNVYVSDFNNHRIQKFSSNGTFLTKWGSGGNGDGQFWNPFGVGIDSSDKIYVADQGNHRIQKFSSSGTLLNQWGSYGSEEGKFNSPKGVAIDSTGLVYVTDSGNNRIQMFSGLTFANFRTNVTSGYAPLSVQFTDLSKDVTEWHWEFGDGFTSTDRNSTHTYTTAGKYVVNLTVSKANGDKSSKFATIGVLKTTPVYYSGNGHYYDSISVAPGGLGWEEANLLAQSLSYSGMTGHLATITSQDENDFIVNRFGVSDYWLSGIQPSGSTEPDGSWQWVTGEPWAYTNWEAGQPGNFYAGGYPINLPWGYPEDALHFHGNSMWNDVPRECPIPGYIVEYEVNLSTSEPPVANFTTNTTSGYEPLSVQFTDLSENAAAWNWDFGDGANSTLKSPMHTYSIAGDYLVNLTVSNANGTNSTSGTITVSAIPYENYTFATKWYGDSFGQLNYPCGIAKDSSGNVYVADYGNNRMIKFDSSGNPIIQWGSGGNGVGQFNSPYGVAVDSSGNVYVSELRNHRIQKFNSSGAFLIQWGSYGSSDGQFNGPAGIAIDPSGNVYVVDASNYRIQKFDSNGVFIKKWGAPGSSNGQFNSLSGLAVDPSGNVYAADVGNARIQKFSSSGTFLTKWGVGGSGDGQFSDIRGVAVDSSSNVYVSDIGNNRVQKFSSSGTFLTKLGVGGSGDGQLYHPESIAVDSSGTVYVADSGNNRIQMFSLLTYPIANFSINVAHGYAPLSVQFTDLSKNAAQWNWNFGDGNTSNERSPVHTYSTAGNYTVNLTISNENGTTSRIATIIATTPFYYSENGHYYDSISVPGGISWDNAKTAAESVSYSGMKGHLATITSLEENEFIFTTFNPPNLYWLGGFQPDDTPVSMEPAGNWHWVTGESWDGYMNWYYTEPNNWPEHENALVTYNSHQWADVNKNSIYPGYVVEYDVINPTPQSVSDIQSSNGSTWINWTWTNPADPDFNHTEIYLNGAFQTNTSAGYFNATDLQPETTYEISTRTVDNKGNVNQTWVNATAKTGAETITEDFNVSISTDKSIYDRGETVNITGKAQYIDGSPVANTPVSLNIKLKGYTQTYSLVTDSNGSISYNFKSGKTGAGNFTAKLSVNSNGHLMSAETSFNMYGLYMIPSGTVNYEMSKNSSENITFSLWNYGETDLHGVNISLYGDTIPGVETQVVQTSPEILSAGSQGLFIVKISSTNVDVSQANYTVRVRTDEGSSEEAKLFVHLVNATPAAIVNPTSIEVGMNPDNNLVKTVTISNAGYESMNDITISKPSLDWVSVSPANLGSISPGMNKSFNIFLNPGNNTAVGVYQETIAISSSNHQPVNMYMRISVTSSEKGGLMFHVVNDLGENVSGASIKIQNPAVLTEIFAGNADENGYYIFENISAGTYNYFVTASGHSVSGSSIVSPGVQTLVEPVLPKDILGVKLNVTLVQIDDDYVITPSFTFETDVPPPLLIPDPVAIINGVDPLNPVYEKDGNITISNSGLISVFNVTVDSSSLQGVNITFPTENTFFVDEIKAKSSITIPYHLKVTNVACGVDEYRNSIRINGDYLYFEPRSDITHIGYVSSEIPVFAYRYNCPVDTPNVIEDYFTYIYSAPAASYSPIPVNIEPIPQVETVHERVKFNIPQKATFERDAFDASLELTNKQIDKNIEDVSVNLTIKDKDGNDAASLFFISQPSLSNINSIDGSGIINPSSVANANWLLVPKNNTGGTDPSGKGYTIQAFINYTVNGVSFNTNSTEESITVIPQPLLNLIYMVPENVTADKPFNITLTVANVGYGAAKDLKLDSGQPVIYENKAGLLITFELIGSGLINGPQSNSMLINFGDLAPGESKDAYWIMKTSLGGNFTEFYGSFSHSNALGGSETSLINGIKYIIVKESDTNTPSSISNLQSTNGTTWINWTWTNPADPDFSHTEIYLNGTFQTNTSAEYFNAIDLQPETEYTLGTRTVDINGNVNETLVNSTVTTSKEFGSKIPIANFTSNITQGSAPLSVQFSDYSENATEWNWDFGDGNTSTEQNATHTYYATRSFTVTLTVSNEAGTDTEIKTGYITVKSVSLKPVADFSASPTLGIMPLNVSFTDLSTGTPTLWSWSFGDGNTSTEQNPSHIFSKVGKYTIKLTAKNALGSNSTMKTNYIDVEVVPVANFSANKTVGKLPMNVKFTDKSTGTPTLWFWDFGDGNTSTEKSPTNVYGAVGRYNVTLTATNAVGNNTITKYSYIDVEVVPLANFTADPTLGIMPLNVSFTDISSGDPTSWKWNFGDGSNSTEQNPSHIYNKTGKFTVSLTAKNAVGSNTSRKTKYIDVEVIPVANFTANKTVGKMPMSVKFTDKSTGTPTSWYWEFGDGNTSTEMSPTNVYGAVGKYNVTLTATNGVENNTITKYSYIDVEVVPVAEFSAIPTLGAVPLNVSFTDLSTGAPTSWTWDLGDKNTSTEQNPSHVYSKGGQYTVKLTAKNAVGSNTLTKSKYITVEFPPAASFSAYPASGKAPLNVSFTDKSTGYPESWNWSFGDGTFSSEKNPIHNYTTVGKYNVNLTVINLAGNSTKSMVGSIKVS